MPLQLNTTTRVVNVFIVPGFIRSHLRETYIATNVTAYSSYLFEGNIDELAIFDYALTASDVDDIFNATSTGKTADLSEMDTPPTAWYRMGD